MRTLQPCSEKNYIWSANFFKRRLVGYSKCEELLTPTVSPPQDQLVPVAVTPPPTPRKQMPEDARTLFGSVGRVAIHLSALMQLQNICCPLVEYWSISNLLLMILVRGLMQSVWSTANVDVADVQLSKRSGRLINCVLTGELTPCHAVCRTSQSRHSEISWYSRVVSSD